MKIGIFSVIGFLISSVCWGEVFEFYVSPQGDDNHPGSKAQPVATPEQAFRLAREIAQTGKSGDSISIKIASGTYYLQNTLRLDERDSLPMVVEGVGVSKPVISGGRPIGGWEQVSNGVWCTFISEVADKGGYFEQLFVNGRRAVRARTPNNGYFTLVNATEYDQQALQNRCAGFARQKFEMRPEDLSSLQQTSVQEQEDVVMTFLHKWDVTRKYPDFMEASKGLVWTSGTGMKPWNLLRKGTRYFLENYRNALDEPGEWFLARDGHLFYIPLPGEDMTKAEVVAPVLKQLVSITGTPDQKVANKQFRGLSFQHSSDLMPRRGNPPMQAAAAIEAGIQLQYAQDIRWVDCEVRQTGNYAFWFREGVKDCCVNHCYLHDLGAGGVKIGVTNLGTPETGGIVVDNNIIQSCGWIYPCAIGVAIFQSGNNKITHNDIGDLRYSGVSVGWVWGYNEADTTVAINQKTKEGIEGEQMGKMRSPAVNNLIADNHIHHIGWGVLSDMGAVYTLGESPGTRIVGNVIHDVYSYDYGGWGLYNDEGSSYIVMENNLVYGCKSGGYHQHYGKENVLRNNILALSHYQQLQYTRTEAHQSFSLERNIFLIDCGQFMQGPWAKGRLQSDYNCFWDMRGNAQGVFPGMTWEAWKALGRDTHSIVENPGFRDPIHGDFHLENQDVVKKIGFVPFDYTKAGVYGDPAWKLKAKLPRERCREFEQLVRKREKNYSALYKEGE